MMFFFFLHKIRLEIGQKGHIIVQKGLKIHEKKAKNRVLDLKRRFFSLAEKGGTPPLTDEFR